MEEQTSSTPKSSNNMMVIVGVIILLVLVGGGAYYFMNSNKNAAPAAMTPSATEAMMQATTAPTDAMQASPSAGAMMDDKNAKTIEVDGKNFSFSPNTMTVKEGETVKVVFKNTQGFHNFVIDEFNVKTTPKQSPQTDEVTFVASKKGTFQYYCAVGKHREMGMFGTLTVE